MSWKTNTSPEILIQENSETLCSDIYIKIPLTDEVLNIGVANGMTDSEFSEFIKEEVQNLQLNLIRKLTGS